MPIQTLSHASLRVDLHSGSLRPGLGHNIFRQSIDALCYPYHQREPNCEVVRFVRSSGRITDDPTRPCSACSVASAFGDLP
jgi:hypothetical protein